MSLYALYGPKKIYANHLRHIRTYKISMLNSIAHETPSQNY